MPARAVLIALIMGSGMLSAASLSPAGRLQLAQFVFGQRCQAAQVWCFMSAPAPVGSGCFCPTPFGPAPGFVVQ
jgi:hypothetical protein